jgi:hypothetical protein
MQMCGKPSSAQWNKEQLRTYITLSYSAHLEERQRANKRPEYVTRA